MVRRTLPLATFALALACQACAPTGLPRARAPVDTEKGHAVRRILGGGMTARVEQHGNKMTVRTTRTCDLQKVRTVERATPTDLPDKREWPGILVVIGTGVSILGLAGTGVAVFTDDSRRLRDVEVSSAITAVGAALITGGVLATVHRHRPVSLLRIELEDGLLQEDVPCRDVPSAAAHEPVTGRAGPQAIELPFGDTDAGGLLEIDLAATLPPSLLRDAAPGATMGVFVREREVGTVRLDEVAAAVEAEAWARAGAEACAAGITEEACEALEGYLRDRPAGAHTQQAREAMDRRKVGLPARIAAAAKQQAAVGAARRGAVEVCRRICATSCQRDAGCTVTCLARSCE